MIALGTNDALNYDDPSEIETHIQQVMTALGPNAKLAWVNTVGDPNDNFSTLNSDVNAAIESAVASRPHSLLIDLSTYLTSISQPSYWVDRVHMTYSGYSKRNQHIAKKSIDAYYL